jgi:hypothetical protein
LKTIGDNIVEIIDNKGTKIFYAATTQKALITRAGVFTGNVTEMEGKFYNKNGVIVAEGTKSDLKLLNVKAIIGGARSGSLGIVLGCSDDEIEYIKQLIRKHL